MGYVVKLPKDTVVTVGDKSFKLAECSYVFGSLNDFDAIRHLLPAALKSRKNRRCQL